MKILFISTNITGSGGVSKVTALKANYFADELHHEVHIISTNDKTNQPFYDFSKAITFHFIASKSKIFKLITFQSKLKQIIKKVEPDLVIVNDNGIKSMLVPNIIPKSIKCFYELHGDLEYFSELKAYKLKLSKVKGYIKKQLVKFDRIIALQTNERLNFISKEKWEVIPNPIIIESKNNSIVKQQKVIAVGRLTPVKGYERLLRIWSKVVEKYPDYVLEIYGDKEKGYSINTEIEKLNLNKNVKVFNAVSNVYEKYQESQFLVHSSFSESFSMVILEAMSFGLPVVCFPLKTDLIKTDYCLISENENEYLKNVLKLIEDENLKNNLGEKALNESKKYELNSIMKKWEVILKK